MFDLIVGTWGEGVGPEQRKAVSVAYRVLETGPSFMVQDEMHARSDRVLLYRKHWTAAMSSDNQLLRRFSQFAMRSTSAIRVLLN